MPNELYHFGIPGMKWGVRRYQNEDGSLTPAGEARYSSGKRTSMRARSAAADARAMDVAADVDRKQARKLYDKAELARARGNDRKADRLTRKADRLTRNADRAQKEFRDRAESAAQPRSKRAASSKAERTAAILKTGLVVGGATLAAYGMYKTSKINKLDAKLDSDWETLLRESRATLKRTQDMRYEHAKRRYAAEQKSQSSGMK